MRSHEGRRSKQNIINRHQTSVRAKKHILRRFIRRLNTPEIFDFFLITQTKTRFRSSVANETEKKYSVVKPKRKEEQEIFVGDFTFCSGLDILEHNFLFLFLRCGDFFLLCSPKQPRNRENVNKQCRHQFFFGGDSE